MTRFTFTSNFISNFASLEQDGATNASCLVKNLKQQNNLENLSKVEFLNHNKIEEMLQTCFPPLKLTW